MAWAIALAGGFSASVHWALPSRCSSLSLSTDLYWAHCCLCGKEGCRDARDFFPRGLRSVMCGPSLGWEWEMGRWGGSPMGLLRGIAQKAALHLFLHTYWILTSICVSAPFWLCPRKWQSEGSSTVCISVCSGTFLLKYSKWKIFTGLEIHFRY